MSNSNQNKIDKSRTVTKTERSPNQRELSEGSVWKDKEIESLYD